MLPKKLFFSRFLRQAPGRRLGEDDCIAEGNLALVQAARDFKGPHEAFSNYAARAIFNAVYRASDRAGLIPVVGEGRKEDAQQLKTEHLIAQDDVPIEDHELAMMLLDRLPNAMRTMVVDKFVHGMTFEAMAKARGKSKTRIQVEFANALKSARAMLEMFSGGCS